jgi:hypothetical protein
MPDDESEIFLCVYHIKGEEFKHFNATHKLPDRSSPYVQNLSGYLEKETPRTARTSSISES